MATDVAQPPVPATETVPDIQNEKAAEGQETAPSLPASAEAELNLPKSSADGIVNKPFARPLDTAKPSPRPELTPEQSTKYLALLQRVTAWTEIPTGLASSAAKEPITDADRMFLTRNCLLRYLRATKWNVDLAETRLRNTLAWRREYGFVKLTPEFISPENETGKQVIQGYDVEGRPCCYMFPSRQNTERSPRQINHLVFMLERLIDLMPPGQETLALLINFSETTKGQGATLGQGKEVLYILQNHYPERLGRACVTERECPFLFLHSLCSGTTWKLVY